MARSPKPSKGSTKQSEDTDPKAVGVTDNTTDNVQSDPAVSESFETKEENLAGEGEKSKESGAESEPAPDIEHQAADTKEFGESVPGVIPATVESFPPQPTPPVLATPSGPGAFGLIFGGLMAGAIGFLVATFAIPEGWPNPKPAMNESFDQVLADQSGRLDGLAADISALKQAQAVAPETPEAPDLGPLTGRLDAAEQSISDAIASLESRFAAIETQIADLEARPEAPSGPDGSAAMEVQMEAFRQQLDEVTADAEARITEAQNRASEIEAAAARTVKETKRQTALASIESALENGTAFSEPLAVFADAPADLAAVATEGVPTLSSLQNSFPAAARSALAASLTVPEDATVTDRFTAFLRRQTNARSLAPREGDEADAILSRAEAALFMGDLEAALFEVAGLPEATKTAMSDWITSAEKRMLAVRSVETLKSATNQG